MNSSIYSTSTQKLIVGSIDNSINLKFCDIAANQPDTIVERLGRLGSYFRGFGIDRSWDELLEVIEKRDCRDLRYWNDRHDFPKRACNIGVMLMRRRDGEVRRLPLVNRRLLGGAISE